MKLSPKSNRNWAEVFGRDADECFQVWHVATYIGKIAAEGYFKADRILNGDQTDWGLHFAEPSVLRVSVYTR